MSRPRSSNPKDKEVLVRLTRTEHEVLASLAHLESITVAALVRRLVEHEVTRMREDPHVAADIEYRRSYAEAKSGDVIPLTTARDGTKS